MKRKEVGKLEYSILNNGVKMPLLGFGVYQINDLTLCENTVLDAIQAGYRMIDTAQGYFNEEAVGKAISKSDVPREDLFITTKLWMTDATYEQAKVAFFDSLNRLGLDYLDLYLIHQPFNDIYGAWRAMTELYHDGYIRAIGVSNFYSDRLTDFVLHNEVTPAVAQIEVHPFHQQQNAIETMQRYRIQPEAWGPFVQGKLGVFQNEILNMIGAKYGKSASQIALRWLTQRKIAAIPKSIHRNHIEENINIFDFHLTDDEMELISGLEKGQSVAPSLRDPAFIKELSTLGGGKSGAK